MAVQQAAVKKQTAPTSKVKLSKLDKMTLDQAIEILKGAYAFGIRLDLVNNIQKWPIGGGKLITKKIVAAGKVLDLAGDGKTKTYKTEWYHPENEILKK